MSVTDRASNLSYLSPGCVTDRSRKTAGLTGVTDVLDFDSVTGDRFSQFGPHVRAGETNAADGPDLSPATPSRPRRSHRRPTWLYDGPLTDRTRIEHCPRCRTVVLRALANERLDTSIELHVLTPAQELTANLAGRHVLTAALRNGAVHLDFRYDTDIRAGRGLAVVAHDCRSHPPMPGPADLRLLPVRRTATAHSDQPPF